MTFDEKFYVISSNSYIKILPTFLSLEFLKELKNEDGTLKPHISYLNTNATYYGKPSIQATLPSCFVEIVYKHDGDTYLIEHEVFLYEENYPTYEDLDTYKEKLDYGFASQVTEEINDLVDCHHNSQGRMCLSNGDY